MSTISGTTSSRTTPLTPPTPVQRQAKMQERMFQQADADGSGGVNASELTAALSEVTQKTGVTPSKDAATLMSESDANGDGNLSSDELGKAMQILRPPKNTMDFAQSRSGSSSDSGQINESELSQTEFDASRPSEESGANAVGGAGGPGGVGGKPPPPPMGAQGADSTETSTTYDELDTNQDGVVSALERMTVTTESSSVQTLLDQVDANTTSQLAQQLTEQYTQVASGGVTSSTGSTVNTQA